jgi:hypothetical protein
MKDAGRDVEIGVVPANDVDGPYSLLTLNESFQAHDLAGDGTLLFVAQCAPPGTENARVFHQETKRELGQFPAPARGFVNPFKFRLTSHQPLGKGGSKGTVYMMDGLSPKSAQAGIKNSMILKYEYEYEGGDRLTVNLVKEYAVPANTIPFERLDQLGGGVQPNGAIYPTGFDLLDERYMAVSDCFSGTIWLFDAVTGAISLAFGGPEWLPQPWPEDLKVTLSDGSIRNGYTGWTHKNRKELVPYIHLLPTPTMPGLHGLTLYENGPTRKIVFESVAIPGIFAMDVKELLRSDIAPHEKKFETVVPPIRGVASWVGEVQDDKFNPGSPWVYFHRTMSRSNEPATKGYEKWVEKYNPLYRVNMETGVIQFVAEDWKLWDLDSCINAMPGKPGFARITSTPVQQHRIPMASALIEDLNDYSRLPADFVFPVIDVRV